MADELDQLLVRHVGEPRPPVPKDWNKSPGILSGQWKRRYPPWAPFGEARRLIAHGMIEEGRALHWRLIGNDQPPPRETTAFCLEHLRPPPLEKKFEALAHFLPQCESLAFRAMRAFERGDANAGPEALLDACNQPPASESGAVVLLLAWLAWSDVYLQTQLLHRIGKTVESGFAISPVMGYARLMLRQHRPAWESFTGGAENAMRTVDMYRAKLGLDLDAAAANGIAQMIRSYCTVGRALVLYDLCFDAESKAHFRSLQPKLAGALGQACGLLS